MKRSFIILVCSFVSVAILLARTESPQTPATPPSTTQKTSATTAKTATSKTPSTAPWTTTGSGLKYQDVVVGKGP